MEKQERKSSVDRVKARGPLFPLLFTLVVDGLNKLINGATKRRLIKGLNASKNVKTLIYGVRMI